MSDSDNLRVRIVKLPATLAEAMLYDGLRANDPSFAAVLAQSETVLIIGAWTEDARMTLAIGEQATTSQS